MRLTWRDGAATLLTAAVIALYTAYAQGVDAFMLSSPRAVGAAVFAIGLGVCALGSPDVDGDARSRLSTAAGGGLGLAALAAAIVAIAGGSGIALAVLVGVTAVLWAFATARHAWRRGIEPPVAETQLEQHKDELPPRLNVG